ncbi:MAG: DUF4153 domain-containing protein [Kiritimatiellae bacterium]|nr:DUF4153 domain-containing protein [Kiritimatiellia bacterium]
MIKASFSMTVNRIRNGIERFWLFHICSILIAVQCVLANHDVVSRSEMVNMVRGIVWGALTGLFVQLLGEWRRWRSRKLYAGIVTLAVGVLGCWIWTAIGKDSPRYGLWIMLYCGTVVSLVALSVAVLYRYCDERMLFSQLALNAFATGTCTSILMVSQLLCILAFKELIFAGVGAIAMDFAMASYIITMSVGFLALLPDREQLADDSSEKASAFLFWLLLPASLLLLLILYLYLGKIIVKWSMPSGELNWFGSLALALYAFFWLALRDSQRKFFQSFVRWGWMLLLPVLAMQILGIVIRYLAYGLTTPRFAGMITLSFGIAALTLAALKRRPQGLFVFIAASGLFFTLTPINIIDVPVWNQERRLKAALERSGLVKDGIIEIKEDAKISRSDAKIIVGAWDYLVHDGRWNGCSIKRSDGLEYGMIKPTLWYRPSFTAELCKRVDEICHEKGESKMSLPKILCINDVNTYYGRKFRFANIEFCPPKGGTLPISGYSNLELIRPDGLDCRFDKGRWYVELPEWGERAKEKFDVTEYMERILQVSGCDRVITEHRKFNLNGADAVWELRPGLALAVGEMWAYTEVGKKLRYVSLKRSAILTKEGK